MSSDLEKDQAVFFPCRNAEAGQSGIVPDKI
jgi:hypothetical protein